MLIVDSLKLDLPESILIFDPSKVKSITDPSGISFIISRSFFPDTVAVPVCSTETSTLPENPTCISVALRVTPSLSASMRMFCRTVFRFLGDVKLLAYWIKE